mmetsp:Transcript_18355/g.46998  ORF Transcript_18355/g.46998 Transcript_18355/m.46998 type:complete len:230 (+) Transcript_18355:542-1231(+)
MASAACDERLSRAAVLGGGGRSAAGDAAAAGARHHRTQRRAVRRRLRPRRPRPHERHSHRVPRGALCHPWAALDLHSGGGADQVFPLPAACGGHAAALHWCQDRPRRPLRPCLPHMGLPARHHRYAHYRRCRKPRAQLRTRPPDRLTRRPGGRGCLLEHAGRQGEGTDGTLLIRTSPDSQLSLSSPRCPAQPLALRVCPSRVCPVCRDTQCRSKNRDCRGCKRDRLLTG